MCFSTEASFTAAIVLGGMGYATSKSIPSKQYYFLAIIPLLFALQQLNEGFIWYNFAYHALPKSWLQLAVHIYLVLAFLIWPIWIPMALFATEMISWRRLIIGIDLIAGIGLSCLNFSYALKQDAAVQIINHSIQYLGHVPDQTLLYPCIVLLPCFLSSLKNISIFGLLVAAGYILADYFYQTTFVSVWCFFSAIVSLLLYKILRDNQTQTDPAKKPSLN